MKVWIIIMHLSLPGGGAGSDLPAMHGHIAFSNGNQCERFKATLDVDMDKAECRELTVIEPSIMPRKK